MQGWKISATAEVTLPYKMDYKTFPIQPYSYNSSLITDGALEYLSLPSDSKPMGIIYDNYTSKVWIALYWNRSIAVIDVSTMNVTVYPMPWQIDENYYGPLPWTLATTPDDSVWFSINTYMVYPNHLPSFVPYLGRLDASNNLIYIYYTPVEFIGGQDIKYYNDFIWYLTSTGLLKINYTSYEIIESYPIDISIGFMDTDIDSLWISSLQNNLVTRFNITAKSFDVNITGFDRPLGIEVDNSFVYVAENTWTNSIGTIARINKTDYNITRLNTTSLNPIDGPYSVLKDSFGNLWWTDHSYHVGVFYYLNPDVSIVYNSRPYCYFMTEVPGSSIWFSAVGSAYVGVIEPPRSADVNNDGIVNMRDITAIILDFNTKRGDENYKPECDLDNNGIVNMRDVTITILCFNKRTS